MVFFSFAYLVWFYRNEFDALMQMVEEKMERIRGLYEKSDLPDQPDIKKAENILIEIREEFY